MIIRSTGAVTGPTLSDEQLAMLRALLDEQRQFRVEQLAAAISTDDGTDADHEIQDTILRGARLALADIEAALARMATGQYGRCVQCGTRIPLARLEILPQAAYCMACQPRD